MKHRVTLIDGATGWGTCSICGDVYLALRPAKLRKSGEVWVCKETLNKNPAKAKPKRKPKSIGEKCDDLWSLLVRERSGYKCLLAGFEKECGGHLHPHHLIGRTEISTRWVLENGVCLCYAHHIHGVHGTRATEMNHELLKRLPEGRMDELNDIRRKHKEGGAKIDKQSVLQSLTYLRGEAA